MLNANQGLTETLCIILQERQRQTNQLQHESNNFSKQEKIFFQFIRNAPCKVPCNQTLLEINGFCITFNCFFRLAIIKLLWLIIANLSNILKIAAF